MLRGMWFLGAVLAIALAGAVWAGYELAPSVVSAANPEEAKPPQKPKVVPGPIKPRLAEPNAERDERAWLGVQIADASGGARVVAVVRNSPAANADLRKDDVITGVNGSAVANAAELIERIGGLKPADKATLSVLRGESTLSVEVTLGGVVKRTAPAVPQAPGLAKPLGIFGSLGALLQQYRDLPPDQRFDHLRGSSFSFTDKDNNLVTIDATPGVVTAVSPDAVTIRPNGSDEDRAYSVTDQTRLLPGSKVKLAEAVQAQDKVMVVALQGSNEALALYDQTAIGRAVPKGRAATPTPGGKERSQFLVPGQLKKQLQDELNDLRQRFGRFQQHFDQVASGPAV